MNDWLPFILIPLLPVALLLGGYTLAAQFSSSSAAQRLALATLAGLGVFLLTLSVVNFVAPLDRLRALFCLWPIAIPFLRPTLLLRLRDDAQTFLRTRHAPLALLLGAASLVLVIWPELTEPKIVVYDGTSSHDAYFWTAGAKRLQSHTYMETAPLDREHPWANSTRGISGWQPAWGRVGAETLLAFTASLLALDPVQAYLPVTAALLACWLASVYLLVRTFWLDRLTFVSAFALFAFPALFVFYRANANLPNLLGALTGAAAIVATTQSLRAHTQRWPWLVLLALAVHGTFFAYPEIAPFIALPAALLLARELTSAPSRVGPPLLALLAGLAVNPATTVRALHGLAHSFRVARANVDWVDTFERIRWPQYPPALATLSLPTTKFFGPLLAGLASVLLIAAAFVALRRAQDRFGAAATLSGCAALLVYTPLTDFAYGWQKSIQFAGPFVAALLPVAALGACCASRPPLRPRVFGEMLLGGAVALLFATAMVFHFLETNKWASRRFISNDWSQLHAFSHAQLYDAHVRIEPATFPMSFFHGMWATYFLPDARLSFGPRGDRNGGYLHETVATAQALPSADTAAFLVSRAWAETFEANSPRLFTGDTFALLSRSNQVVSLAGFLPAEGPPQTLSSGAVIELRPHTQSELQLTLGPDAPDDISAIEWRVTSGTTTVTVPAGPAPWNLVVPLTAGELHRIEFIASAADSDAPMPPFTIAALRVVTLP